MQIRGVTFRNSGSWTLSFLNCRDMVLDGFRIESRENPDIEKPRFADAKGRNNDGVDLMDCQQVRMVNCFINSGDDSIVLKSLSPEGTCRDITIANCVVSSNASGIKVGTESAGAFEDVVVQTARSSTHACEGLAVLTVDGARRAGEFLEHQPAQHQRRRHSRAFRRPHNRTYRKGAVAKKGSLKNVMFSQIQGTRISSLGNAISGGPGQLVENVVLRDINLEFTGGGTAAEANRSVPEMCRAIRASHCSARFSCLRLLRAPCERCCDGQCAAELRNRRSPARSGVRRRGRTLAFGAESDRVVRDRPRATHQNHAIRAA